jgi:hypothetical protein
MRSAAANDLARWFMLLGCLAATPVAKVRFVPRVDALGCGVGYYN